MRKFDQKPKAVALTRAQDETRMKVLALALLLLPALLLLISP